MRETVQKLIVVVDGAMRDGEAVVAIDTADRDALVALLADHARLGRLLDTILENT